MSSKRIEGSPGGVSNVELSLYRNDNKKKDSVDLSEENKEERGRSASLISSYMRRSDSFTSRFRNVSTAEEMKELARRVVGERKGQWWILMPNSTVKIYWESIVLFLLMYTLVVLPLRVGFSESEIFEHESIVAIDLVVDMLFGIDIIITSISAYESKQNLITNQRKICFHYLCSLWFPLDLLAAIPFHLIFTTLGTGEDNPLIPVKGVKAAKFLKFMRLIRVLKLMRLHRVWPVFAKLEDSPSLKRNQVRAGKICFVLVSAFHFFACLWVFLGDFQMTYFIDITPTEIPMWSSDESTTLWSEAFWLDSYSFWKLNNGLTPMPGCVSLENIVIEIGYYLCPNDSNTNSTVSIFIEHWDENDDVVLLELGGPKQFINASDIMEKSDRNLSSKIICDRNTTVPSFILENDKVCDVWNTDDFFSENSALCGELELHTKEIRDSSLDDLNWIVDYSDECARGLNRELFLAFDNKTIFIDYISPANLTWTHTLEASNTWFDEEGLDPTNVGVTYLTSFYWSVTTLSTVGYGDISPTNIYETVYVTIVMVVGAWIFSYVTASVTSFSVQKDKEQKEYRKKMRNLHAYLQDTDKEPQAQLPPQLKEQLLNRMQIIWRRRVRMNKGKDMVLSFWQDLPESLRWQVARRRVKPLIDKCEFLYTFEKFVDLPDKEDQCILKVWRSVHKNENLAGTVFPSGLKVPKEGSWFFPREQTDLLTPMKDRDVFRVVNKDPTVYHEPLILDKEEDQILGIVAANKDLNDRILPSSFKVPTSYGSWVIGENDDGKLILKNSLWTQRDENFLGFIAEHLQPMYFLKDEVVCSPGDKCDKLYIIYSGLFSLYVRYPDDIPGKDDDLFNALNRQSADISNPRPPSSSWRPFFGFSRQGSKVKLNQSSSSPKLTRCRTPRGKNDKMFVLKRGDLFGHVALFKTHCFKGTILATTTECVVRYITVENLRNILWNRHPGGPQSESESKSYQQREAKRYFENRVDVDYRQWFKGAFDGAMALNSEKWSYEDAVRGIGKSVKRLHNSLLGKEEKNRLKAFFIKASEDWANKTTANKRAERLKKGHKLLRYVDLFLSRGVTVSKVISLSTKNSVSALNILPPILVGCLWEYLKARKSQGPASWTPADLAQHIRSWGDELASYAAFFELDRIDGQRFLGLDRKGIRKIEILPKSLEETLLNHITNLRRIQTDKRKSEIEQEPPKESFSRSHTYHHRSMTKLISSRLSVSQSDHGSQLDHSCPGYVNKQFHEPKTLLPPDSIPLEEPMIANWNVDLDATDSVLDGFDTPSFCGRNGTTSI